VNLSDPSGESIGICVLGAVEALDTLQFIGWGIFGIAIFPTTYGLSTTLIPNGLVRGRGAGRPTSGRSPRPPRPIP
jgi:hypothetical protein